jgi:hypothetical protein
MDDTAQNETPLPQIKFLSETPAEIETQRQRAFILTGGGASFSTAP